MIRRPPRSTRVRSSAASDVYKRQRLTDLEAEDFQTTFRRWCFSPARTVQKWMNWRVRNPRLTKSEPDCTQKSWRGTKDQSAISSQVRRTARERHSAETSNLTSSFQDQLAYAGRTQFWMTEAINQVLSGCFSRMKSQRLKVSTTLHM